MRGGGQVQGSLLSLARPIRQRQRCGDTCLQMATTCCTAAARLANESIEQSKQNVLLWIKRHCTYLHTCRAAFDRVVGFLGFKCLVSIVRAQRMENFHVFALAKSSVVAVHNRATRVHQVEGFIRSRGAKNIEAVLIRGSRN